MSSPASLIIHFVGLVLFSSQVPNDCGVKVILPQVVYSDLSARPDTSTPIQGIPKATVDPSTSNKPTAPKTVGFVPIAQAHHVEDHVALLVFPAAEYIPGTSWGTQPTALGTTPYLYVKLDGERIRFNSGALNQAADIDNLELPGLRTLCPSARSLNANFQPPYRGAAAVFDLPEGKVNACIPGPRFDTEVTLDTNGQLIISASTIKTQKEIRLQPAGGTFELIVANVPVSCLANGHCSAPGPSALDNVTHVHAYYAMGNGQADSNDNESIAQWIVQKSQLADPPVPSNPCVITDIPAAAGGFGMAGILQNPGGSRMATPTHVNPPPDPDRMTDFECSNSKWP